jgi:hypothetical protein
VFTHAPPQAVCPAVSQEQEPPVQVAPVAQALPHRPQFASSVITFTQASPQGI